MLKVCHILSGDLWAGAEVSAYELLRGLRERGGIECSAIILNEGKLAESIRKLNIDVHILDENKTNFFQIVRGIRNVLKQRSPHIVHSHGYKQNISASLASLTKRGISLVATQHGLPETDPRNRTLSERIIMNINFYVLSARFRVVAVSRDLQKALINEYEIPENKVEIIHNGILIPPTADDPTRRNRFAIGSAGRFFPVKDYPFMVEVAKEVIKKTKDIRFVLAGDGPEIHKIKLLIQKHHLENFFSLPGFLRDMDLFYEGLDLYINTSRHEGIPMTVLEAMSRGIPVIAPKTGGVEEIIDDGVQGFLIGNRDPRDFAEKCLELYRNSLMRKKMGTEAREKIVKNFSVDHMVRQYHQAYLTLREGPNEGKIKSC